MASRNRQNNLPPLPQKPARPPKKWTSLPTPEEEAESKRIGRLRDISFQLVNNEENFTAREIFELYRDRWPQLLEVTAGCMGTTNFDQFSAGETMRIHKHFQYPCAVARDTNGRILSIPMDFSVNFKLVLGVNKYGPEQTLSEIVAKSQLPVTVKFAVPDTHIFYIDTESYPARSFGCMALLDVYKETYLLGNPIHSGVMNPAIIIVPLYLEMLISTVTSCKMLNDEEWKKYLDDFTQEANKVNFDTVEGRKAMAIYPELPPEIEDHSDYDYIYPDQYVTIVMRSESTSSSWKHHLSEICQEKIYDEIAPEIPKRGEKAAASPADHKNPKMEKNPCHGLRKLGDQCLAIQSSLVDTLKMRKRNPGLQEPRDKSSSVGAEKAGSEQTCVKDSPVDIESLGIEELCGYLDQLRLHKYVKVFKKNGISGTILNSLTPEILTSELHFKDYEAIKLMAFVNKGHIPR